MIIGERIRLLRETKKLSQGDIEKRTGLLRCYISRVENGHTVPAIETLEKLARAMEIPLYQLFYDGEEPPVLPNLPKRKTADDIAWGSKAGCLAVLTTATAGFCFIWPRRWPTASFFCIRKNSLAVCFGLTPIQSCLAALS
jgi:DNA-binding XRE family transcriptional regulator